MLKLSFHFVIFRLRLTIITFCNLFIFHFHDLLIILYALLLLGMWFIVSALLLLYQQHILEINIPELSIV